jgi:hypothetical protein
MVEEVVATVVVGVQAIVEKVQEDQKPTLRTQTQILKADLLLLQAFPQKEGATPGVLQSCPKVHQLTTSQTITT